MFDPETETALAVYCNATGHDRDTAIERVLRIGFTTWREHPHYRAEQVCGRVMRDFHTSQH